MNKYLKVTECIYDCETEQRHINTLVFCNPEISLVSHPAKTRILVQNSGLEYAINCDGPRLNTLYLVLSVLFNRSSSVEDLKAFGLKHVDHFIKNNELRIETAIIAVNTENGEFERSMSYLVIVDSFDSFSNPVDIKDRMLSDYVPISGNIIPDPFDPKQPLLVFNKYGTKFNTNVCHHNKEESLEEKVQKISPENKHEEQLTDLVGKETEFMEDESDTDIKNTLKSISTQITNQNKVLNECMELIKNKLEHIPVYSNSETSENHNVLFQVVNGADKHKILFEACIGAVELLNVYEVLIDIKKNIVPTVCILNHLFLGKRTQLGPLISIPLRINTEHRKYKKCDEKELYAITKDLAKFLESCLKELTQYDFRTRIVKIRLTLSDTMICLDSFDINGIVVWCSNTSIAARFIEKQDKNAISKPVYRTLRKEEQEEQNKRHNDKNIGVSSCYESNEPAQSTTKVSSDESCDQTEDKKKWITVSGSSYERGYIEFTIDNVKELEVFDTTNGVWLKKDLKTKHERKEPWQYVIPVCTDRARITVLGDKESFLKNRYKTSTRFLNDFLDNLKSKVVKEICIKIESNNITTTAETYDGEIITHSSMTPGAMSIAKGLEVYKSNFC